MEVEAPEVHETTLFANEKEAFALEPVPITRKHNSLPWAHIYAMFLAKILSVVS